MPGLGVSIGHGVGQRLGHLGYFFILRVRSVGRLLSLVARSDPRFSGLDPGNAAFSALAVLPNGMILCLFKAEADSDCARFNLEWVTQ